MLEKLRTRIALAFYPSKADQGGKRLDLASLFMPGQPVYTDLSVKKATREGYKLSLYVYRCIRVIVQAASGIPWIVLDKDGEEIPDHHFTQKWARPNKEFSGQDNMEFIIAHLKLVGNSLIQPIMVAGKPEEYWICMPDLIKPIPAEVKGEWLKGYEVREADGSSHNLPPETFIHFMQFDPGNPFWGVGDLMAAARTVDTDNEAQDTQKVSMQNRGIPSGIFGHERDLDEEQLKEQTRRIEELYLQKSKRRAPWVLGSGVNWQAMSLTPVEMDFIASRLQNKRDIAAAFGVDPWFLGDNEHSSYNNILEAKKALYENTVIPLLEDMKSTLNLRVAPLYKEDITITYDLSNVQAVREDFGKKVDQASKLFTMGVPVSQINEQLELGLEEFEGWDTSYLPFNLMPAGSSSAETPVAKMMTKALNLTTEEQKSVHWKRVDRRRQAWVNVVQKRILPLYEAEEKAVIKAITGEDVNQLKGKVGAAIEKQSDSWEKTLKAIASVLIEDFGNAIAEDLGATKSERKWSFDPFSLLVQAWLAQHAAEGVTSILATNLEEVRQVISSGVNEGLSVAQIGSKLRDFYSDRNAYRAMRVARTEVSSAAGYGQREAARQSGVASKKQWISSRDERVRTEHQEVDGEIKGFDEPYSNGLMYPGDTSGPPEQVIQCRCVEAYLSD